MLKNAFIGGSKLLYSYMLITPIVVLSWRNLWALSDRLFSDQSYFDMFLSSLSGMSLSLFLLGLTAVISGMYGTKLRMNVPREQWKRNLILYITWLPLFALYAFAGVLTWKGFWNCYNRLIFVSMQWDAWWIDLLLQTIVWLLLGLLLELHLTSGPPPYLSVIRDSGNVKVVLDPQWFLLLEDFWNRKRKVDVSNQVELEQTCDIGCQTEYAMAGTFEPSPRTKDVISCFFGRYIDGKTEEKIH